MCEFMESRMVEDLQNLHMLATFDFQKMDELVQDLTNALEESTHGHKSVGAVNSSLHFLKRHSKRRRGRLRRSSASAAALLEQGKLSEASESSLDEALLDYMEHMAQHSDSDELLTATHQLQALAKGSLSLGTSLAESDSVPEHFSPIRPHRRRRRDKRMTVDPYPDSAEITDHLIDRPRRKKPPIRARALDQRMQRHSMETEDVEVAAVNTDPFLKIPLETKKTKKGSSKTKLFKSVMDCSSASTSQISNMNNSSCVLASSVSSSDSEGVYTNDESRDGDDEQSDFFHEPGPTCGLSEIIPWWEREKMEAEEPSGGAASNRDHNFEKILSGSLDLLTPTSQRNFKARVSRLLARSRDFRTSRKRLKDKKGLYSFGRHRDSSHRLDSSKRGPFGRHTVSQPEPKLRHKSPQQPSTSEEHCISGMSAQIQQSTIGNQLLQGMGWRPGSGASGSGVRDPGNVFMKPHRLGLGMMTAKQQKQQQQQQQHQQLQQQQQPKCSSTEEMGIS